MMRRDLTVTGFVLVNFVLLSLVVLYGLRGPLTELSTLHTTLRLMEIRSGIKERNLAAYDENTKKLLSLEQQRTKIGQMVLPYARLTDALAGIGKAAEGFGLRETVFETHEPVAYETGSDGSRRIWEIKISAAYEGTYGALCDFTASLRGSENYYRIERLTINADGAAAEARLELALYAEDDGVKP